MTDLRTAICVLLMTATPAVAIDLPLPGNAVEVARVEEGGAAFDLPSAPWDGTRVPTLSVEGQATRIVWQIPGQSTARQIVEAVRPAIEDQGWQIVFECRAAICGGYDFRFAANTLPAPEMYVDLGSYSYLLAEREDGAALSLMVSQAGRIAYVQANLVDPAPAEEPATIASSKSSLTAEGDLAATLDREGRVPLDDLRFASGAATLGPEAERVLDRVAEYILDRPESRFAIVGHTDNSGSLDANVALSDRRARAVRDALVERHDVPPARIEARGIGSLAPRGPNDTDAGRGANRRVEIVRID